MQEIVGEGPWRAEDSECERVPELRRLEHPDRRFSGDKDNKGTWDEDCRLTDRVGRATTCWIGAKGSLEEDAAIGHMDGPLYPCGGRNQKLFLRLGNGLSCPVVRPGDT